MKKLIWLAVAFSGVAGAACENVYNPMTGQWEYQCTPIPSSPYMPVCHLQYDPMNQVWVNVCN